MGKKKVVLDLNILVSGFGWDGQERKVLQACFEGEVLCVFSEVLLERFRAVLDYEKLTFMRTKKEQFLFLLSKHLTFVDPSERLAIIKDDPEDDRVLECALAAAVDYIVTGDHHLLQLRDFRGIQILNAGEFIERELS